MPEPRKAGRPYRAPATPDPLYLGIDPGYTGGVVALRGGVVSKTARLCKMTEQEVWDWFYSMRDASFAVIEDIPPAIFGTGKSSMSKLYGSYMALRMALVGNDVPHDRVKADVWQPAVGLPRKGKTPRTKWKKMLRERAQQLFPGDDVTADTADAFLIAEYCRRLREGAIHG